MVRGLVLDDLELIKIWLNLVLRNHWLFLSQLLLFLLDFLNLSWRDALDISCSFIFRIEREVETLWISLSID